MAGGREVVDKAITRIIESSKVASKESGGSKRPVTEREARQMVRESVVRVERTQGKNRGGESQ